MDKKLYKSIKDKKSSSNDSATENDTNDKPEE